MSKKDISVKIEHILSQILSRKYDAEIKIKFEERDNEQGRDHYGVGGVSTNAGERDHEVKEENSSN